MHLHKEILKKQRHILRAPRIINQPYPTWQDFSATYSISLLIKSNPTDTETQRAFTTEHLKLRSPVSGPPAALSGYAARRRILTFLALQALLLREVRWQSQLQLCSRIQLARSWQLRAIFTIYYIADTLHM